jgi:hypothetical protein
MTPEGIEPPIFGSGIRRVAIAPWSHVRPLPADTTPTSSRGPGHTIVGIAVLAERLRRTLKARVRKSVGSIPTDCIDFTLFCCDLLTLLRKKVHFEQYAYIDSSVRV